MTINVGEYGLALNLNVNYDLGAATTLQVLITRPDGTTITGSPVVGQVSVNAGDLGIFAARQYAIYTIVSGDINQTGTYRIRLIYADASKRLISDVTSFDVYS